MSRKEAQVNAWNTFRQGMVQYAESHPEYSLDNFMLQRVDTAYACWREARAAERVGDWRKARALYLKAVGCLEQAEKLMDDPVATKVLYKLKEEYQTFATRRDPIYRLMLKHLLRRIKDEPGILQTELYRVSGNDQESIRYVLYFAAAEGLIRREEKGRSYQLFFVKDKEDQDTFQDLGYDEFDDVPGVTTITRPLPMNFRRTTPVAAATAPVTSDAAVPFEKPTEVEVAAEANKKVETAAIGCGFALYMTVEIVAIVVVSILTGPAGPFLFIGGLIAIFATRKKQRAWITRRAQKSIEKQLKNRP